MNRRQLIKSCIGLAAIAQLNTAAADDGSIPYTRDVFEAALESGKPFLLDFYATW